MPGTQMQSTHHLTFLREVQALYHNNPFVQRSVVVLLGFEILGMIVGLGLTLPGIQYDELCHVTDVPLTLIIYG